VNSWSCARQPRTQLSLNCKLQPRASAKWPRHHFITHDSYTRHRPAAPNHHTTSPNPRHAYSIHSTTTYQCSNTYHNLKHRCAQQTASMPLPLVNLCHCSQRITQSRLSNQGIREMGRCPITLSGAFCQACSDAEADRHILKRAFPYPIATPTSELNISVNRCYSLLSTVEPPLPFVRPADVVPPTAMEAGLDVTHNTNKLPVVTMKSVSNPVVLDKGNYRMPDKVVVGEPLKRPAVAAAPTRGTMGPPPPGPLKKQKR
jgi:hypothetical protein